jgi:hypothetical protein
LGGLPHGVEHEEIFGRDIVFLFEVLHAHFEISTEGVLEGDAENKDSSTVVASEINAFGDLTACDGEENCTSSNITCFLVILQ